MTGHVLPVHPQTGENTKYSFYTDQKIEKLMGSLLVEEVVVHLDFGIGLEVIWHEHDGYLNMT